MTDAEAKAILEKLRAAKGLQVWLDDDGYIHFRWPKPEEPESEG
jgi:hypothetical protein